MKFKLIVALVNPDLTEKVVKVAKKAGATGDVIIQGKGNGIEESNFLGLSIQDKTNIILFVVEEHHVDAILSSVSKECQIEEPGNGIMMVLSIEKVAGLARQIKKIRKNLINEIL